MAAARWSVTGKLCQLPFLNDGALAYDCAVVPTAPATPACQVSGRQRGCAPLSIPECKRNCGGPPAITVDIARLRFRRVGE